LNGDLTPLYYLGGKLIDPLFYKFLYCFLVVVVVGRLLIEDSSLVVYVLMSSEEQCMNVCKFQLNEYNKGILF
jgi:hypothetical protein